MGLLALMLVMAAQGEGGSAPSVADRVAPGHSALDDLDSEATAEELEMGGPLFWVGLGGAGVAATLLVASAAVAATGELVAATPTLPGSTRAVAIYTVWWAVGLGVVSGLGLLGGGGLALYGALE